MTRFKEERFPSARESGRVLQKVLKYADEDDGTNGTCGVHI
jgi:hypothetical protein